MEDFTQLATIFAAYLTPTIAIIGSVLAIQNYRLAKRKRRDELFDRRYKFLLEFEKLWKTTGDPQKGATRMCLEWDDIAPFAQKAYYLFGEDIAEHLKSYEGKSFDQNFPWVPDQNLAKPFAKYLCFED
ncbi:Uncharacterised protein [Chryseobacterium nakagawai]|uniref:Uncharacterized protein n=1 Tax=Chryseobacterium nakagawai TaxID=1241982 RepID=A0AAD1DRS7_CHRNA|nr:hypothetical protein [Chryseobacterium nakagawai]AZA91775.1 hypothetical protein EG343_14695 [Chryseobacterium nakagawai]VEH18285.1 Uncharacterised protein [Chryseobacterium nakagawai]